SDESKNEKGQRDKGTKVMKDNVSQEHVCAEEVPLNNNIRKQSGELVEMPSKAVEQGMDDHVPNEIGGAKYELVPNHVVNKGVGIKSLHEVTAVTLMLLVYKVTTTFIKVNVVCSNVTTAQS
nr:hypothetical protein [Tanacetum cinerariifolium]